MNYQQAMDYMEKAAGYGIVPGLTGIRELLRRLGDPQKGLKIIHLAGTNGKGSVQAFLTSILIKAGFRTGAYVSPVFLDYREKFQIQGKPVSKAQTIKLVERVSREADKMEEEGFSHPTLFEMETAMSFLLFQEKKCSLAVVETGMGGEEDATNVIENPLLCIFTSISMDHMAFLGDTQEAIARQKAGIMKAKAIGISAPQAEETKFVLQEMAQRKGLEELIFVDEEQIKRKQNRSLKGQKFSYRNYRDLKISLLGSHQCINASLAVEGINALIRLGYPITEKAIRSGLEEAVWPGRFQILCQKPVFVADGAHNEAGARELKKTLEFYFTNKRIIYIIGMFRDKEWEKVLGDTLPLADHVITVSAKGNPRALSALELAKLASGFHPCITAADSVEEGVELAFLLADRKSVIVAFGSLAYLGDCIRAVKLRGEKRSSSLEGE